MKLTILATSDTHGFLTNESDSELKNSSLSKVAAIIRREKNEANGPVITIENGDFLQGSAISHFAAKEKGVFLSQFLSTYNSIGYDCGIIGNHEFNYGQNYLKEVFSHLDYPCLCGNITNEKNEPIIGEPYKIFEKEGIRIGVLGLTTQTVPMWEHPKNIEGLQFHDCVEMAKYYVPIMKSQADIVIVSYHGGVECDFKIGEVFREGSAENKGCQILLEVEGIDALVAGHQHYWRAGKVNSIPVIQPGYHGSHVGKIVLEIKKNTKENYDVINSTSELLGENNIKEDATIEKIAQPLQKEMKKWLKKTIGAADERYLMDNIDEVRRYKHPFVELLNKIKMEATDTNIACSSIFNNEKKGFGEIITREDVWNNHVYPSHVVVSRITGKNLKDALEYSAKYFLLNDSGEIVINPNFINYQYDMYDGIEYIINVSEKIGQRITRLTHYGKEIQDDEVLEVALDQYRAVGAGGYTMYNKSKIIRETNVDGLDLIISYIETHSPIPYEFHSNYQVIKK